VSGPQGPYEPAAAAARPIDPNLRIGHVHLRTADIDRVRDFYVGVMGFDVIFEARDVPGWGTTGDVLFLSSREQLAEAVGRLVDAGIPLRRLTDHGTHLAVYLSDPDGNDLELAWDRPFAEWPRYGSDEAPAIDAPFELDDLLASRPK
jgi:catechol 2,3-dioxygenase